MRWGGFWASDWESVVDWGFQGVFVVERHINQWTGQTEASDLEYGVLGFLAWMGIRGNWGLFCFTTLKCYGEGEWRGRGHHPEDMLLLLQHHIQSSSERSWVDHRLLVYLKFSISSQPEYFGETADNSLNTHQIVLLDPWLSFLTITSATEPSLLKIRGVVVVINDRQCFVLKFAIFLSGGFAINIVCIGGKLKHDFFQPFVLWKESCIEIVFHQSLEAINDIAKKRPVHVSRRVFLFRNRLIEARHFQVFDHGVTQLPMVDTSVPLLEEVVFDRFVLWRFRQEESPD